MDLEIYVRFLLALLAVLALIAALTWVVRRFGFGGHFVPNAGKTPRLAVVEVKTIDPRRKLVLVR
ncbi:MAG: flagellar biosynthetic protein FliO, partial [Alphaproteobacteria bacterium]